MTDQSGSKVSISEKMTDKNTWNKANISEDDVELLKEKFPYPEDRFKFDWAIKTLIDDDLPDEKKAPKKPKSKNKKPKVKTRPAQVV